VDRSQGNVRGISGGFGRQNSRFHDRFCQLPGFGSGRKDSKAVGNLEPLLDFRRVSRGNLVNNYWRNIALETRSSSVPPIDRDLLMGSDD
jgi:hypothetical protein